MNKRIAKADIVKEHVPVEGGKVHGVTFDGELVWFARDEEIVGFDPKTETIARRIAVPARAGTAFDGENFYQLAGEDIFVVRKSDGRVLRKMPSPGKGTDSGMAWGDGHLWVGQYHDGKIHKIDPKTGEIVKTLVSDRFVTGVCCVDGAIWHGVSDTHEGGDKPSELRRLAPDGTVDEVIVFPPGVHVAGVESDGKDGFWCGGEAGKLRHVRRGAAIND
ncbi:MAG TPA: glutamine cyclotransferase [Labilithrix sp.]